jgi:hypothetical protein
MGGKQVIMQLPKSVDVPMLDRLTELPERGRVITKSLLFFFGECEVYSIFGKLRCIIGKYPCRGTDVVGQLSR